MVEPINRTIEVSTDPKTAFAIFTDRMANWWPLDTNSVSAMSGEISQSLEIEPRVGGQLIETKSNGEREIWARVKAFEPGERLVLAWHVMAPEDKATEVEIRFTANGSGTRVDLTHRGWEIMGEDGETNRGHYENGWVRVFEECFAGACAA